MCAVAGARTRRRGVAAALILATIVAGHAGREACADEGGASFWVPGQSAANLAATLPSPGWSLPATFYYYAGRAPRSAANGGAVAPGTRSSTSQFSFAPTYVPPAQVLGGQLALSLSFGMEANVTHLPQGSTPPPTSDSLWGATDVAPAVALGWQHGAHSWAVYLTGNVPTGRYDATRLANTGLGHAALDAGVVHSWESPTSGHSVSTAFGVTGNFTNPDTDYRSGADAHLGVSAMTPVSPSFRAGVTGYLYYQLTGDGGAVNACGPCKSRVAGVGPQLNYAFDVAGREWSANLRGYYEFWARNRLQGYAVFASIAMPL